VLAELKGLRLRAPSEVVGALLRFGASPQTMPMADVYSALGKGMIDGVIAPNETLQAQHFSDVARYVTTLSVARGAYPSRAISDRAYRALPPDLRAVLDGNAPFWESELAAQVQRAERRGEGFGRAHHMQFITPSRDDQRRFDQAQVAVASEEADRLRKGGVNGPEMLAIAQKLIARYRPGTPLNCNS
jgi:TRAP-type C4-dicarboxylate transport system substrate-binding protein